MSEETREQAMLFKRLSSRRKPGIILICTKLFPCFSCCSNRSAQIVQGTYPSASQEKEPRQRRSTRNSLRKVRATNSSELAVASQQTSEGTNKAVAQNVRASSASPRREEREAKSLLVEDSRKDLETSSCKESPYEPVKINRFREKKPSMLQRIQSSIAESLNDFSKARDEDLNDEEASEPQFNKDVNKFQTLADSYSDRMALVLKIGAGGDQQSHV